MKRVYVNEKWCLGCHLCEYYCAFANSGKSSMVKALKDHKIAPRIRIEERNNISFAVSCRHCTDPLCVKGCISGALTIVDGGRNIWAASALAKRDDLGLLHNLRAGLLFFDGHAQFDRKKFSGYFFNGRTADAPDVKIDLPQ